MKRTKLIMSLITCCFALSVLAFGVYAVTVDLQFKLNGAIKFDVPHSVRINEVRIFVLDSQGEKKEGDQGTKVTLSGDDGNGVWGDQLVNNEIDIGSYTAESGQKVEIDINLSSVCANYLKVKLTHNEISGNTDYTSPGPKIRSNSVFLPKNERGILDDVNKTFKIYILNNGEAKLDLKDLGFTVSFEEISDLLQEDKENEYWYVEMGTVPTTTGSEYIRWRYFTSYIDPESNGNVNSNAVYTYKSSVRPTPNSKDGTGCFILETNTLNVRRWDGVPLNYCNYCNEFIADPDIIDDEPKKYHKTGDLETVLAYDYATSTIRDYINGRKVYKVSDYPRDVCRPNEEMDKSDMLTDFCIDEESDYIYSTMIQSRKVSDLYVKNRVYYDDYADSSISDQALPQDINGNVLHKDDSDNFWLLSFWEAYYILGTQTRDAGKVANDKVAWANDYYSLRSVSPDYSGNFYNVALDGKVGSYNVSEYRYAARAAFKMTF